MFDLTSDIKSVGLNLNKRLEYAENVIIYFADYYHGDVLVSKYIFVACDSNTFSSNIYRNDQLSDVVEKLFFELQNDLSWNLYLVCVLETTEYKKLPPEDVLKFQDNKEYTRNLIITRENFKKEIPVGRILIDDSADDIENPFEDWETILAPSGLEFCLTPFSNQQINDYIKSSNLAVNTYQLNNNPAPISSIRIVNGLQLTDKYRPFCFGKEILLPFGYVNLLSGPNGTGKTSILQAIESVLTGEVRIGNNVSSPEDASTGINLTYNDTETIQPPVSNQEKKNRESNWYKNRDSERTKPALNNAFHIYNHFSAEDTFLFSFDDEQPDYEKYFTKMLFGEEVKAAERSWIKYKEQFCELSKNSDSQKKVLLEQLNALNSIEKVSQNELTQRMDVLGIKYNQADPVSAWQKLIITLHSHCTDANDLPEITDQNQLDHMFNVWEMQNRSTMEQLEELQTKRSALETRVNEDRKALQILLEEKNTINNQKSTHQYAYNQLKSLEIIKDNINVFEELKQFYSQQLILSQQLEKAQGFFSKYQFLQEVTYSYAEISTFTSQLSTLRKEKCILQDDLLRLQGQLKEMELQKNSLENVVSNIRSYGKTYIDIVKGFKGCPLCGNQDITAEEFRAFLNQEFQEKDDMLHRIHQEIENHTKKISLLEEQEKKFQQLEFIKNSIDTAFEQCDTEGCISKATDSLTKVKIILGDYNKAQDSLSFAQEKYTSLLSHIKIISPELASSLYVNDYTRLIIEVEGSIPSFVINEEPSMAERLYYLIKYLNEHNFIGKSQLPVLEEKCKGQLECIENLKKQLSDNANYISMNETLVNQNSNEKTTLNRLQHFFNNVVPLLKDNVQEISHVQLLNQCSALLDRVSYFLKSEENTPRIVLLEEQLTDLDRTIDRSKLAYEKLCQLRQSSEYAQKFIMHNIKHISEIFGSLHMPKEFDNLIIHEGKIAGQRNDHLVFINRMSTGQKTAVAISVFLTLNATMKTAPQFILIDEPVANIDDLNILSLLDFLREMVISNNKQIFFTTASYNVRRLFRRKFSFLENEFIELSFDRIANLRTTIIMKQYNQSGLLSPETKKSFSD